MSTKYPSLSHLIQNSSANLSNKIGVHKKVAGSACKSIIEVHFLETTSYMKDFMCISLFITYSF